MNGPRLPHRLSPNLPRGRAGELVLAVVGRRPAASEAFPRRPLMAGLSRSPQSDVAGSFVRYQPLLRDVSRSFYLTVRALPRCLRRPIGLAYLLARATDTVADTEAVAVEHRLALLEQLRERILGQRQAPVEFGPLVGASVVSAERELLNRLEVLVGEVKRLSPTDRQHVREVLSIITSGQELDLRRFACASAEGIVALQTEAELEDYIYRVAGCVGEFWTRLCRDHLFRSTGLDFAALLRDGVRFGKGLQLVNVLRDLPRDLRQGRCYLPADRLAALGLRPQDLLAPTSEKALRPLYNHYLDRALDHLRAGWAYTCSLPKRSVRLRLACAWPVLIGVQTLARLREAPVLAPDARVKVPRAAVRTLLARSILLYPSARAWEAQFERAQRTSRLPR